MEVRRQTSGRGRYVSRVRRIYTARRLRVYNERGEATLLLRWDTLASILGGRAWFCGRMMAVSGVGIIGREDEL